MSYAIAAYVIVIGVLVAYAVSLASQRRALERQVDAPPGKPNDR